MNKKLKAAYSRKEKAELLLSNLEKLKAEESITEDQYGVLKAEYTKMHEDAIFEVNSIKARIKKKLASKARELEIFQLELNNLQVRFEVGQIPAKTYMKREKGPKKKWEKLEKQVSELQALVNSSCSADISAPVGIKVLGFSVEYPRQKLLKRKPPSSIETTEAKRKAPAGVSITNLQIMPDHVTQGSSIGIIINMTNSSQDTVTHKVELRINGEVKDSNEVTLASGKSQEVTFVTTADVPGDYKVAVDGLTGKFSVMPTADTT